MAAESAKEFEALEAQAMALLDLFKRAGYEQVAPSILQPADVFLDRIGEQVRSLTYMFTDLAGGPADRGRELSGGALSAQPTEDEVGNCPCRHHGGALSGAAGLLLPVSRRSKNVPAVTSRTRCV